MNVRISARTEAARPRLLAEQTLADGKAAVLLPQTAAEGDDIRIAFAPPPGPPPAIRIFVGSVLVASTLPNDRCGRIDYDDASDLDDPPLTTRGKFFADWVGNTELIVTLRAPDGDQWLPALTLPVAVSAGKLTNDEFDRLTSELERESAAVLLDIYGKTHLGLKDVPAATPSSPVAILHRIKGTILALDETLRLIGRNPARKLQVVRTRELAVPGQAVTEATLAEACLDPRILGRAGGRVAVREHLREHTKADYRLPEHRAIAGFAAYLQAQLSDLRGRIDAELAQRHDRRRWRNAAKADGGSSWWEREDLPRIAELEHHQADVVRLSRRVREWAALPFLPAGTALVALPSVTPLFRSHALYRRAFLAIRKHFRAFQTTLDSHALVIRARSLPVLYEWWCTLRVIHALARGLAPLPHDPLNRLPVATRLAHGRKTLTIEFETDQAMTFEDGHGGRVRFRYNPAYRGGSGASARVGLLGGTDLKTPDVAIEIFPAGESPDVPTLIVVLDAKYSTAPQRTKADEVKAKYSLIGDHETGTVLSRQVWALTPAAPAHAPAAGGLNDFCTVDNAGFWSDAFVMSNQVTGAVQTRPLRPAEFDPLAALIERLLVKAGIRYAVRADG